MNYRLYTDSEKSMEAGHLTNEDRYMFSETSFMEDGKIRVMAIADGMGGMSNGGESASNAVRGFMRSFYTALMSRYSESDMKNYSIKYSVKDIEEAMKEAFAEANREVCMNAPVYYQTGTTLSAVCVVNDCAVVANIGDSPIYYYNNRERKLRMLSELHTKAERDVHAGLYERYSREYYKNDNILYGYIGQYSDLRPDDISIQSVGKLSDGDIILTGSDGAFGRIRDNVIYGLLTDCSRDEEGFIISQLFELASLDGDDDQTAIMYIVEGEEQ